MERRRYSTDLSDDEWRCIGPHLPEPTGQGRPRLHGLRAILAAVFYVLKSGCPWRLLPKDFPPWKTVYDWFRRWRIDGTWDRLNAELRERLRWRLGRNPNPSAAIVDSQSVRTTGVGGQERGFDPAKKVEGRKRHLLVDTEGLVPDRGSGSAAMRHGIVVACVRNADRLAAEAFRIGHDQREVLSRTRTAGRSRSLLSDRHTADPYLVGPHCRGVDSYLVHVVGHRGEGGDVAVLHYSIGVAYLQVKLVFQASCAL